MDCQPSFSPDSESIFFRKDERQDHTEYLPTVDHDSTTTEIPNFYPDEEQLPTINRSNSFSPSPRPQKRYFHTINILHYDGINFANQCGWGA